MSNKNIKVFYSYSHKDESYRDSLETHLSMLKRKGLISEWHDRKIIPGTNLDDEIDSNLNSSDLVLLLVSPDFIASEYCYCKEMSRAIKRHENKESLVVPIIIRPTSDWKEAPFGKLTALPQDGKPVTTWENQDEAWVNVTEGLKKSIELLNSIKIINHKSESPKIVKDFLKDEIERIDKLFTKGSDICSGIPIGFEEIDRILDGIHKSDLIVVAGRPQMGKTDFVANIATYISMVEGVPCVFYSLRVSADMLFKKILSSESEIEFYHLLKGNLKHDDFRKIVNSAGRLAESPLFIDNRCLLNLRDLHDHIKEIKSKTGLGVVVIDGVHNVMDERGKYNTDSAYIARNLKNIARELQIAIIVTLSSSDSHEQRGENKRPILSDLQEWPDYADAVLFIHRQEDYKSDIDNRGFTEIDIAKNIYGPTKVIELKYNSSIPRFYGIDQN